MIARFLLEHQEIISDIIITMTFVFGVVIAMWGIVKIALINKEIAICEKEEQEFARKMEWEKSFHEQFTRYIVTFK